MIDNKSIKIKILGGKMRKFKIETPENLRGTYETRPDGMLIRHIEIQGSIVRVPVFVNSHLYNQIMEAKNEK